MENIVENEEWRVPLASDSCLRTALPHTWLPREQTQQKEAWISGSSFIPPELTLKKTCKQVRPSIQSGL